MTDLVHFVNNVNCACTFLLWNLKNCLSKTKSQLLVKQIYLSHKHLYINIYIVTNDKNEICICHIIYTFFSCTL